MCCGGAAHQRALLAVAVAAGAEDDDQLPVAEPARGLQHVDERVGRVRVVDDHRVRLSLLDGLEAARHAVDALEPAGDRVVVDPELACRPHGAERVRVVEAAAQPERERQLVVRRERARVRQLGREPCSPLVAHVHDGALGLREEGALRRVVLLHRAVEVEVVLREVREHEHREPRAGEPSLRAGDRRRLHRARAVARVQHLAEEPLQVDRLRRVQPRRPLLAPDPALDVREQRGPPPGFVEDRVQQEGGRRLAVRAGDRGDVELLRRLAEEARRRRAHRRAHARHEELRDVQVEPPLDDEGDRAGLDRLRGELVQVVARTHEAEEERSGCDCVRVVGEVEDLDRRRAGDADRLREAVQIHRARNLAGATPPTAATAANGEGRPGRKSRPEWDKR